MTTISTTHNSTNANIGFIGAGNMSSAMVAGLIKAVPVNQVFLSSHRQPSIDKFINAYGLTNTSTDNTYIFNHCDVIILSVKPQILPQVLHDLQSTYANLTKKPLLISVAAGISCESIAQDINDSNAKIARVMPNLPSQIGEGMSGVFINEHCSDADKEEVQRIVDAIGDSVVVDKEEKIHLVTAVSGSGPGYVFYFIESLINAAIASGLNETEAKKLALQTAKGAAILAYNKNDAAELRQEVCLQGGTTEQGIRVMREADIEKIVFETVSAAKNRSIELSQRD